MTAWGSRLQVQVRLESLRKLSPAAGFCRHIPASFSGKTSAFSPDPLIASSASGKRVA